MQTFQFEGTVAEICPVQTFGRFQKQEVVVNDGDAKFPQEVAFAFKQSKIPLVSKMREGDFVKVEFAIEGREWNGRHFTDLSALQVFVGERANPAADPGAHVPEQPTTHAEPFAPADPDAIQEELPF